MLVDSSTVSADASAAVRAVASTPRHGAAGRARERQPEGGRGRPADRGRVRARGTRTTLALPYLEHFGEGVTYVGEGDAARLVKICHNLFLGVVAESLAEIAVLAERGGVPRREFFEFLNASVMGSTFTRYKTPAYVNRTYTPTFTLELLRKDFDLGLDAGDEMGVPLPTMQLVRGLVQEAIDAGQTGVDFASLLEVEAARAGLEMADDAGPVADGLGTPQAAACGRRLGAPLTCTGRGTRVMQPIAGSVLQAAPPPGGPPPRRERSRREGRTTQGLTGDGRCWPSRSRRRAAEARAEARAPARRSRS